MRRVMVPVAAVAVMGALIAAPPTPAAELTSTSRLEAGSLAALRAPPPEPKFSRTTYAATDLSGSTELIDRCEGPVAIWLGEERPTLVAEHDYCGGSAWVSKVKVGDAVKIDGEGVDDGIFVVTRLKYETRNEVTVGDLPEADVVLQTCVTKTSLVLVALERFEA